jgi:Domain of unknown function (DUF4136)
MLPRRSDLSQGLRLAVALAVMFASGCAAAGLSIKYSYDARATFPELKTYKWQATVIPLGRGPQDPLLEANVAHFADQILASKGFTRNVDSGDLLIWIDYDVEFQKRYQIESLTLTVARADNRNVIWRGTAAGHIETDAASKTLENVVTRILSSFPPK